MDGDDQVKSWRDYRLLRPLDDINVLFRRSEDSGWVATGELLQRMGWTNLQRLFVISGDILGGGIMYVLLPDETVASVSSKPDAVNSFAQINQGMRLLFDPTVG